MKLTDLIYDGKRPFDISSFDTGATTRVNEKEKGRELLAENVEKMASLQDRLYAEGKQGLLVIFQAMDAGGKDSTIKHVFSGINPQGIKVTSFKEPSAEELEQGYLWRISRALPPRGTIGVFNRSHYEEVLISKVLNLPENQKLPARALGKDLWKNRYRQLVEYEQYLHENGYTILKFFLNISKEEQRQRFLSRLEEPEKNWKFSLGDLDTREHWNSYMKAFQDCINNTSTRFAPWYVIPADRKWFARYVVSEFIVKALEKMNPQYPVFEGKTEELHQARERLENE